MAVWKDARVSWKGNVISSSVRALSMELGSDAPEATAMGDNWREFEAGGLKTASVEMEINWAAGSTTAVDSLFGSTGALGQSGALTVRPTTGAIAAGNPEYSGNSNIRSQANLELLNLHRTHNSKSGSKAMSGASSSK